jgi:hypothetical protein
MSFAGISLTVLVLAAAFVAVVALGFTGRRRAVIAGIVAFYPATLIYQTFPWYSPETNGAAIAMWVGCFLVCFWALRDRINTAAVPRLGRAGGAVAMGVAALTELIYLYAEVLPLDAFFSAPAALTTLTPYADMLPLVLALLSII